LLLYENMNVPWTCVVSSVVVMVNVPL
jgi:hypothetical protein